MVVLFLAITIASVTPSIARPIIADLSLRTIEIDSGFNGINMLLFGARNDAGDIVVVVRGPKQSYLVREKERVGGLWVNRNSIEFSDTSSFYSISSSRPLEELHNEQLLTSLGIGLNNVMPPSDLSPEEQRFKEALESYKRITGLYPVEVGKVSFIGDTLFRSVLYFPENISRGTYTAEIYLIRNGGLAAVQSTPVLSYKMGLDAFIYDLAYTHPILYGILAVLIALVAGWIAGTVFRKT
jgi:uncharacterized protein (TIGR02186 family)